MVSVHKQSCWPISILVKFDPRSIFRPISSFITWSSLERQIIYLIENAITFIVDLSKELPLLLMHETKLTIWRNRAKHY